MSISITPCPHCTNTQGEPVFSKDGFDLLRCTNCHLIHVSPMPSAAELTAHYQNPAYFAGEKDQGYHDYADMEKVLLPLARRRLALIDQQVPTKGRLLDFGCAAGYFLQVAAADGWQIDGVELSTEMATQARQRLGVSIGESLESVAPASLDVVTLWEVIEHLPTPISQLRELRARLRPGGLLMLSTPNTGHWKALRQPDNWEGYRPPSHLLFYTRHTLTDLLTHAGFERVSIQATAPLPPLPGWLERLSLPLYQSLANGQAHSWKLALYAWRAIRLAGWVWQKVARPNDDIFATLEAVAYRPR